MCIPVCICPCNLNHVLMLGTPEGAVAWVCPGGTEERSQQPWAAAPLLRLRPHTLVSDFGGKAGPWNLVLSIFQAPQHTSASGK